MYLGIDYGDKRVGLAIAEARGPAVAWKILVNKGLDNLITELKKIVIEQEINLIVVGLPVSFQGKVTERTDLTEQFVDSLRAVLNVDVVTEDERLTSTMVTKETGRRQQLDDKSAALILQTYIDRQNASHA